MPSGGPISLQFSFAALVVAAFLFSLVIELQWPFEARLVPETVSIFGLVFSLALLVADHFVGPRHPVPATAAASADDLAHGAMDLHMGYAGLSDHEIHRRATGYFLWTFSVLIVGCLIGFVPALVVFALLFTRIHGQEKWSTAVLIAGGLLFFLWLVFDRLVHETWPPTLLGSAFPVLRTMSPWF